MHTITPRAFKMEDLIPLLLSEHETMRGGVRKIAILLDDGDFDEASVLSLELKPILTQHILDEESQVLKFLIELQGRTASEEQISVIQQHRQISDLLTKIEDWKKLSHDELEGYFGNFASLLEDHMTSEEEKVFPSVLKLLLAQQHESKPSLIFNR
jgi:hemerythrin